MRKEVSGMLLSKRLIIAVLAAALTGTGRGDDERLQVGDRLPTIELDSLATGKSVTLQVEGGRLTFRDEKGTVSHPKAAVGMFVRYCGPTSAEMARLQKLHERHAKDGLLVFAVSMLPDAQRARERSRDLGVTYPVLQGYGSDLGRRYSYGCPLYVIDAGGVVRYEGRVGLNESDRVVYEAAVRDILTKD